MNKKKKLIIAGVHKAGTTSLFNYLAEHPDVYPSIKKETHYYTHLRYGKNTPNDIAYDAYFKGCKDETFLMDASPSYLYGGHTIAQKIKEENPNSKIIIILRDPTDRFISYYNYLQSEFRLDSNYTLESFIHESKKLKNEKDLDLPVSRAYREGCYGDYLSVWFDVFGSDLKLIFVDELKTDTQDVMVGLCEWLSIDPNTYKDDYDFKLTNQTLYSKNKFFFKLAEYINTTFESLLRKNPAIKTNLRNLYYFINKDKNKVKDMSGVNLLRSYYAEENTKLKKLLDKYEVVTELEWLK
jgi:hypothetical protein